MNVSFSYFQGSLMKFDNKIYEVKVVCILGETNSCMYFYGMIINEVKVGLVDSTITLNCDAPI